MQIVIDIDEDIYNRSLVYKDKQLTVNSANDLAELTVAVANGIPLPEGYSDLKDMGNLKYVFDLTRDDPIYSGKDIELAIKSMKSIIKANNAESDDIVWSVKIVWNGNILMDMVMGVLYENNDTYWCW